MPSSAVSQEFFAPSARQDAGDDDDGEGVISSLPLDLLYLMGGGSVGHW